MNATNNITEICNEKLTEDEFSNYIIISWWFEYFLQTRIGIAGLFANTLAIPILCSREMNSIFNRLLIFLAIFDNLYIICSVLEGRRKHTENFDQVHEYAFGYILYPLHNFVLCCSIYITVALALERYRAVWRPIEYHNKCKGIDPWRRVITSYVLPVVIFSIFFNIPKLFEVKFVVKAISQDDANYDDSYNESISSNSSELVNVTLASPSDLRLQDHYVIFYVNAARLLIQGVIPFICLSLLNYRIYWVIKRRRQLINRPPQQQNQQNSNGRAEETFSSAQRKANEAQLAIVLFIIVLLFFICHTPRFVLNIHEFLTLETLRKSIEHDCNGVSVWALGFASISHCLMTLNSSVNFFIYGFMCSIFRQVLFRWVCSIFSCCCRRRAPLPTFSTVTTHQNDENVVRRIPASPNLIEVSVQHLADVDVNVESQVLRVRTGRHLVQFEVNHDQASNNSQTQTDSNGQLEIASKKKSKNVKMEQLLDTITTECSISEVVSDNRFLETSL